MYARAYVSIRTKDATPLTFDNSELLSYDDVDINENGEKAIGLDWHNNNSARASRFFVDFVVVTARLRRENA